MNFKYFDINLIINRNIFGQRYSRGLLKNIIIKYIVVIRVFIISFKLKLIHYILHVKILNSYEYVIMVFMMNFNI